MQTECLFLKLDGSKLLLFKELTAPEDGDLMVDDGARYIVRHVVKNRTGISSRLVIATEYTP